jgi:diguanylate cyclase (GGDEF)-like protein
VSVAKPIAVVFSPRNQALPDAVTAWLHSLDLPINTVRTSDQLMSVALRGRPRVVAFDARTDAEESWAGCERLKADSYTSVVPAVIVVGTEAAGFRGAFEAGADEVVRSSDSADEVTTRLDALLRRSDRDLTVHPSTRLPGAVEIEADVQRRLLAADTFAMCYADLDHFKEFNDRYSYNDGDRVIRILARILHDVVKGVVGEQGFVGHIGGDDFIFVIPVPSIQEICAEVISVFDTLIPFQYSEQDRRAGYFFGKDRRGQLHRVPLMTLSIGVVTNERRHFTHAAQVSELATEMKSYAKTLPGSVFSIDRRTDPAAVDEPHPLTPSATGTTPGGKR